MTTPVPKYLYKLLTHDNQLLAVVMAPNEEMVWAWSQGKGYPTHRLECPDHTLSPGITVVAAADMLDGDMVDRLRNRYMKRDTGTQFIIYR